MAPRKAAARALSGKRAPTPWIRAVAQARKDLKIVGFEAVKRGSELHRRATELHEKEKAKAADRRPAGGRVSSQKARS